MGKKMTEKEPAAAADSPPETGIGVIEGYVAGLPGSPGVYRMINKAGDVLYVGKAKNLKKRVSSYTRLNRQTNRIRRMVMETAAMEFVTTHTEAEALLLEANLIKRLAPRYNILLRDDKSFPSILVTGDHEFPQVLKHRGAEKRKGDYFGPFASVWAVNETLTVLQRAFLLRTCSDSVFASRTRPCLLFQIKRCAAPCVDKVGQQQYADLVEQARSFLAGESQKIQKTLSGQMQAASDGLEFELAAQFRDRIRALTRIQMHQDINFQEIDAADVIAAHQDGGQTGIQVFFIRGGRNFGNRAYFPSHAREQETPEVLEAFLGQFYANKQPPKRILLSHALPNQALVADALTVKAGRRVGVSCPRRGGRRKAVEHACNNAREALGRRMAESASQRKLLEGVARVFDLDGSPGRIEVYDNSHVSGAQAVGAMIVAGAEGFMKKAYRKFTIKGAAGNGGKENGFTPGDDYAMMREVLSRRFARALKEDPDRQQGQWPDLVLIDGGPGHLGVAREVFAELGVEDVAIAAIAKGPDRNAGRETIYRPDQKPLSLQQKDPVLYFLQRLRDEAHRFAIGAHRGKRGKAFKQSALDAVPGIGAIRKKALLHHFGSAKAVGEAGRTDLEAVDGISTATANRIYDWFHDES